MRILALALLISFYDLVFAGEVYDKISDTEMRITETKQVETVEVVSLSDLKRKRNEWIKNKEEFITTADAKITDLNNKIEEAEKLGLKETVTEIINE